MIAAANATGAALHSWKDARAFMPPHPAGERRDASKPVPSMWRAIRLHGANAPPVSRQAPCLQTLCLEPAGRAHLDDAEQTERRGVGAIVSPVLPCRIIEFVCEARPATTPASAHDA